MKKGKLLLVALVGILYLAACNNAGNHQEGEQDAEMTHDEMHEEGVEHGDHEEMTDEGPSQLMIPDGAKVYFANLEDGATVSSPVIVEFGIEGMEVEPAGELNQGKGHHHIIINGSALERGVVVPTDSMNIHFGKGQTETEIELEAGSYTLTMQFADGYHQSYGEQLSATINITVE